MHGFLVEGHSWSHWCQYTSAYIYQTPGLGYKCRLCLLSLSTCARVMVVMCVYYCASGYMLHLCVQSEAACSFVQAFKDMYCVNFTENVSFGRYGITCLPQWSVTRLFLIEKSIPVVLDTIRNSIVYEPLARSDDYLNWSNFLWLSWVLCLIAFGWLIDYAISTWFVQLAKLQMICTFLWLLQFMQAWIWLHDCMLYHPASSNVIRQLNVSRLLHNSASFSMALIKSIILRFSCIQFTRTLTYELYLYKSYKKGLLHRKDIVIGRIAVKRVL